MSPTAWTTRRVWRGLNARPSKPHADAMFLLGKMFMSGRAAVLDYERGERMLNDAARMGHVDAGNLVSDLAMRGVQ
jgi:TPR repeat protein